LQALQALLQFSLGERLMNSAVRQVSDSAGKRFVSIGAVLDRTNGIGQGFDTLRIILSIAILCWHSIVTSYGREAELPFWTNPLTGGIVTSLLPIFFALSGFLVMGSAVRTKSLKVFLAARGLRILPALATEVTISAVILGSLVTSLSLSEYFANAGFFQYFGSLIGKIQISLPGVFTTNPLDNQVNGSLWTIAPEILCYTYIAFVIATGLLEKRRVLSILIVSMTAFLVVCDIFELGLRKIGDPFLPHILILAFALGNLLFLWRNAVPFSRSLFVGCLVVGMALVSHPKLATLATPPLVYVTVYLGLLPLPRIPLLDRGDYSYGIYLYAMPVQQSFVFAFPQLRQWYWNILFALPVTTALAMASWSFIEKPALRLRKRLGTPPARAANPPARPATGPARVASPAMIAAILTYGLWLSSTQYAIPLASAHRKWVLAAVLLSVIAALVFGRLGSRPYGQPGPRTTP